MRRGQRRREIPDTGHELEPVIPFFDYPPEIRKVIYTTNAIESVNMRLCKLTKHRGSLPSDEAFNADTPPCQEAARSPSYRLR